MDERFPDNVAGRFAVHDDCTCCGVCGVMADAHFRPSDRGVYHVVHRQPRTADEVRACQDAADACPVDAIVDHEPV